MLFSILRAQIANSTPPTVALTEKNGEAAHLPLPPGVAKSRIAGPSVMLGIRPENLTRYDYRLAEETPYLGTIEVRVEVVEPAGAETRVVVRIAGSEGIARFEPYAVLSVGQLVKLGVDMAKACLCDPETEALI